MSILSTVHFSRRLLEKSSAPLRSSAVARTFSAAVQEPLVSDLSQSYIDLEDKYGAHNYHPLPVVLSKGEGGSFWINFSVHMSYERVELCPNFRQDSFICDH